ncbi:hypothetical protein H310_03284 [Aphanomyces invadans]|uniref:RNase III domain-containing protein n=1 Tax=Aphanomyces invadans TaxID=157072 RepID=A0A024UGW6_9STRA|nr:hypothetical protein H310_03284 [Aphanomyces invadans]ETW05529.1 hypothetical protein H310_03284 [Aphanomyces invadans]|eukprot:XP_008865306.1 hypothetical protein H310_03284 [Aphanomyces invadans]
MSLGEHQKEMVALARQQNVVVSGKSGIGKTFAAAFFIREMLLDHPESKALVLVTSVAKTTEVFKLVSRLCSEKVAVASEDVAHLWQDAAHSKRECAQARVLCVSPSIASHLFYLGHISLETLALIVVEDMEDMFATAATFTERLATKYIKVPHLQRPRLFAMVSKPLSELDLPTSRNPLYKLVTAFCISQPTFRKRATIAPIIVETFQYESSNYADAIGHPVDFLRGANPLHCNAEALYASLLTLGNVSSQYDVLTIESRRKRFVTAAEAILEQLGLWCFLKFIELELRHELKDTLDRQIDNGMDAQAINILTTMDVVPPVMDPKSRIEHHADVQQTQTFLAWIVEQQHKHGLGATNARLKKVADLYGSYMDNARETGRCWVFLQRRVHTRVVAEYMTACFPAYPPCCSMLGSGHGSVAGLDKSDVKAADVEKLFNEGKSPLLVTTAMSTEVEHIAPCDLVICMDEVVDPHKLVDFRQRADPDHGVFKYVIPDTPMELDKYRALFGKMAMLLSLDGNGASTTETLDQAVVPRRNTQQHGRKHHHGRVKYELYHADVKAKMTLENSIQILTAFCHTLPGIKIYDNRPLYMIQRHLMGRLDGRKRCRTDTADDGTIDHRKFLFSASLKLPSMLRVKHNISTPKVASDKQAKCIAAFKAVELLLKRGFLDRSFKSKLLVNRTFIPQESVDEDMELETQNSYDIPPATAVEMGLSPVKSKLLRDGDDNDDAVMHLYGLQGMQYGILCTEPIYGGKTSGRWRFELPTSDVMKPAVQHVPLTVHPTKVTLRQSDLKMALKFHVMLMRLICYGLEAAMSPTNGDIDTEFSSKNDKGYVVVPTLCPVGGGCLEIDWAGLHNVMQSALLRPAWPMSGECGNCIYVSNKRRNVAYVIKKVTTTMVGDVARRVVSNDQYWSYTLRRAKSAPGIPILGRWYTKEALLTASPDQPLVHAIEIPGAVPLIRFVHEGKAQLDFGELKERLLIPDQTSILALTKQQYFDAIRLVPLLFEFERKCQLSTLMHAIGCDIDAKHMEEATTKPAYERLETLGDCFLKLESTWWLYQNRHDIKSEGTLSMLRGDMIRNDRLCKLSMQKMLHHYMIYPTDLEQRPFRSWIPSCMGRTPDPVIAHLKWIADVLESTCGAYIQGAGEFAGRAFLSWAGCSVCEAPQIYNRTYFPNCIPQHVPALDSPELPIHLDTWDLTHLGYPDVPERMYLLQTSLKYTFQDKRLLLEAITHPSVAQWLIQADKSTTNVVWKGDYERLEYLGDALIEYLVVSYAYVQYPTWQPGALSDWKGATVCNDALGKAALICFHMDQIMLTGSMRMDPALETKLAHIKRLHAEGSSERPHVTMPKIFADGFEALCAAVFLDSGCDLHVIRDIFLGPLLSVIGADAVALVTRKNAPKPADLCLPRDTPIAFDAHDDDDDDGVAHVVADPAAHEPSVADDAPVEETVATTAGEAPVAFEAPAAGRTGGDDVVKRARPTPRPIVSSTTPVEIIEIDDSDDD